MPSIKLLKKEINNDIGDLIEEIYLWELSNPKGDLSKSEKLIDEAIKAFDDLIVKINAVKGNNKKEQFKTIDKERQKVMSTLLKKSYTSLDRFTITHFEIQFGIKLYLLTYYLSLCHHRDSFIFYRVFDSVPL